jgi:hypothetical protein
MTNDNKFQITSRPIEGAKYEQEAAVTQKSAEEFIALVDTLLAVDGVEAIRWHQYTPYFNDGEPCEFSVGEATVNLDEKFGANEAEGDYEDGFLSDYNLHGEVVDDKDFPRKNFSYGTPEYGAAYAEWMLERYENKLNGHDTTPILKALNEFNANASAIETVAKANFGDHAVVTATREGFSVDFYEHD